MTVAVKTWTKDQIWHLLETSDKMVMRSVVKIYERQTEDEKRSEENNHNNNIGYNGVDAPLMSSFAKQILAGRTLSHKQMEYARKKIMKYSKQLTKIANGEL